MTHVVAEYFLLISNSKFCHSPTRMVLEEPSFGNKEGMGKEEATRNATKEIFKRTKDRMLTMEEVIGDIHSHNN